MAFEELDHRRLVLNINQPTNDLGFSLLPAGIVFRKRTRVLVDVGA